MKPNLTLKIYDKNKKLIGSTTTHKRGRILYKLQAETKQGCYFSIRVWYNTRKGYYNESALCSTKKELMLAYRAFFDPDLVREFCNA